jgi:hypothetical protein
MMDKLTKNWHKGIISKSEAKLGRSLAADEKLFIESRESYIALEMIEDTVDELTGCKLVDYLNSEVAEK